MTTSAAETLILLAIVLLKADWAADPNSPAVKPDIFMAESIPKIMEMEEEWLLSEILADPPVAA